jgi:acetate kinase
MKILVFNAGSSSLKSRLYGLTDTSLPEEPVPPLWDLHVDWSRRQCPALVQVTTSSGVIQKRELPVERLREEFVPTTETLWKGETRAIGDRSEIDIGGHRVVHGVGTFRESTRITPEVAETIDRLSVFAPTHNPIEVDVIQAIERTLGTGVPQVAVFDTAFHSSLPSAAYVYGGPYEWLEQGIRRYGFHGISHQYCAQRTAQILGRDLESLRLITCHLGNGCSLAAIRHARSVDTSMGFTPLEGLMMGSRSGSVDPGILVHVLRRKGYSVDKLDQVLNQESGLLGVSGVSSDLRQVLAAMEGGNPRAGLAVDVFVHRLRSGIGAMLATLGGLDAVAFTGGIGENSAQVRAAACETFGFLGMKLDPDKNGRSPADQDIAASDSRVRVVIVRAQEDWAIARECWKIARAGPITKYRL